MRLWHKDLIHYLPKQQLISQWRECIAIAKRITQYGSPRHGLVNKVMDYRISHLYKYTDAVICELFDRGYKVSPLALKKFEDLMLEIDPNYDEDVHWESIFFLWHTRDYLIQCYYNLQEKADCGLVNKYDWAQIDNFVASEYLDLA